jgi:pyridoxamine 5'-phosphate oxidase
VSDRWVPLDVEDVDANPFTQFQRWFEDARGVMLEPEAVALATASSDGEPSVRMVLLRYHDDRFLGWYTNYESRKGGQLEANPRAAILWYCEPLGRQIRVEGDVQKMTSGESDAYFATRARGSQLGAHASRQSELLDSRDTLESRVEALAAQFEGRDVPRPEYWGGFRLTPERFEFWQHRDDRLHDRVLYARDGALWRRARLSP